MIRDYDATLATVYSYSNNH